MLPSRGLHKEIELKEPTILTFDEFADELLSETQPRALMILASSQVDYLLRAALEKYFLPKSASPKNPDELFDGDVPLSTFSSRISITRRLGLIDPTFYDLLNKLRGIRNNAAHWRVFGVNDAPLKDLVKDLRSRVENRTSMGLILGKYFGGQTIAQLNSSDSLKAVLLTICALTASIEDAAEEFAITKRKQVKLD